MKAYLLGIATCLAIVNIAAFCFMLGCYQSGNVLHIVSIPRDAVLYADTAPEARTASVDSFPYQPQARKGR